MKFLLICKMSHQKSSYQKISKQRGVAVLAILAVLLIVITSALITSKSLNRQNLLNNVETREVLSQAKDLLLGHSLNNTTPGLLPCPDYDGDGFSDEQGGGSGATCRVNFGFFPYKTVNTKEVLDGSGARLWYAVELNYAREVTGQSLNFDLSSTLVDSTLSTQPKIAAAIILAPGSALNTQQRSLNDNASRYNQYFEDTNADNNTQNFSQQVSVSNNDQVIVLENNQYWSLISQFVLLQVNNLLINYFDQTGCSEFPWASDNALNSDSLANLDLGFLPLGLTIAPSASGCPAQLDQSSVPWLIRHWQNTIFYGMCSPSSPLCLNITGDINRSADMLVMTPGIELSGQSRSASTLNQYFNGDYFEESNNTMTQNFEYRRLTNLSEDFNDVLLSN